MNPVPNATPLPTERFLVFDCKRDACLGVVATPVDARAVSDIGVVIIVGGPQYRAGSHRHFALLARALARAGIPVLRFDYRGMGDSEGEVRTFEAVDDDLAAAINALQRETGVARIVLWGLCDAASAALMYAPRDSRIAGVVALNPWARSPQGEASTRLKHYYLRRFVSRAFWHKLLSGNLDVRGGADGFVGAVRGATGESSQIGATAYLQRMQEGWSRFQRPVLFMLSGRDLTAREFEGWVAGDGKRVDLRRGQHSEVCLFPDADHTFSSRVWRDAVTERTIEWIGRISPRC